jgi:hypothetical protein
MNIRVCSGQQVERKPVGRAVPPSQLVRLIFAAECRHPNMVGCDQ